MRGSGYVLLHVGAVVGKCDAAEEASGSRSGEPRNSRASLGCRSLFTNSGIKTGCGGRPPVRQTRQLRRGGRWTKQRPENTGAGSYKHRGAKRAEIPSRLVMGLLDASSGAHGDFCLRGRNCLCTQELHPGSFSLYFSMCDGALLSPIGVTVSTANAGRTD